MAGRRPNPPELQALAGNPGKRGHRRSLDLEAHSGRVPREVSDAGPRLVWHRAIKPLCDLGVVKRVHEPAAVLACAAIADALELEERRLEREQVAKALLRELRQVSNALAQVGSANLADDVGDAAAEAFRSVGRMARTWSKMERPTAVRGEARQWLSEFGLTPSSSAKLVAGSSPGNEDPLSAWLEESA